MYLKGIGAMTASADWGLHIIVMDTHMQGIGRGISSNMNCIPAIHQSPVTRVIDLRNQIRIACLYFKKFLALRNRLHTKLECLQFFTTSSLSKKYTSLPGIPKLKWRLSLRSPRYYCDNGDCPIGHGCHWMAVWDIKHANFD